MKTYRQTVEDLSCREAKQIVREVRQILWPLANVNVEWSSDEIGLVANVLESYNLEPTEMARERAERRIGSA